LEAEKADERGRVRRKDLVEDEKRAAAQLRSVGQRTFKQTKKKLETEFQIICIEIGPTGSHPQQ